MKKIPTLFERDWHGDRSRVVDLINPEAAWLLDAEPAGVRCTEKVDGTSCLLSGGQLYARYMLREGKTMPPSFLPADVMSNGKQPGWRLVGDGPEDRYHWQGLAWRTAGNRPLDNGTYELVGPKIQGNPYGLTEHRFYSHTADLDIPWVVPTWDTVASFLAEKHGTPPFHVEGLVWQERSDGRIDNAVKIKARDFGIKWPPQSVAAAASPPVPPQR